MGKGLHINKGDRVKIQVNIDSQDLHMLIALLRAIDPSGFFAGKLTSDLTEQLKSGIKSEQVEFVENKK